MNSRIYRGTLMHARLQPVQHKFEYPSYFYVFDLDELPILAEGVRLFSYNHFGVVSLYDKDYLDRGPGTTKEKLLRFLEAHDCARGIARVELVTCARFLGTIFNPASFYYCYTSGGKLGCAVAEVSNTFGETHLYILKDNFSAKDGHYRAPKVFHVSPFFDRAGEYEFKLSSLGAEADLQVNLFREGHAALVSRWWGNAVPITTANLVGTLLRYPMTAVMTLPRIHIQAAKLFYGKKISVFKKPPVDNPMTIRTALPNFLQRIAMRIVLRYLSKIRRGSLTLTYPDGRSETWGGSEAGKKAVIRIRDYNFFCRIVRDGGIGFGEGYVEQDWDSSDVTAVIGLLVDNKPYLERKVSLLEELGARLNRWRHLRHGNTVRGSKRNIEAHYDLSNNFYELFLDKSMTYSCGQFEKEGGDLAAAQKNKIRSILRKARISEQDHVLEIGCGWGAFAIEAVRTTGCRVTGITLSKEQLAFARKRIDEAGYSDRIDIQLCDYRHVRGKFDRIVSIEMLEAVGREHLGKLFKRFDELLKPDGVVVLQVITIPDQRYDSYRRGCDWIQKYIFPGGHLPSLSALCRAMTQSSSFYVEELDNIGPHYARTLALWRERLLEQKTQAEALGFSRKTLRVWQYYFSYCEAAFEARHLNDLQLVLSRTGNRSLDRKPEAAVRVESLPI
ncbi:MAG: DUF1365 family protein [Candidatus Omnitrophota bacterium]|nr:DUF1365 family protein [Candidatus Omnitrophota bacterium]